MAGTTNPVESINCQNVPGTVKAVSLKPLIEHFYLENKRQAIQQVACKANITISHHVNKQKRSRIPPKVPEKEDTNWQKGNWHPIKCRVLRR